jgi:protein-tyrosine phosphatase
VIETRQPVADVAAKTVAANNKRWVVPLGAFKTFRRDRCYANQYCSASIAEPTVKERSFRLHLLFVCTGNICRSPTAERLAAAYAAQLQIPDFRTHSAGTRAVIAHPIHHDAALVLEKLGGDASNFSARQLTSRIARDADLVLTMTRAHRDTVLELAPRLLHRTFILGEASRLASRCDPRNIEDLAALRPQLAADELPDIPDPNGQNIEFFSMVGSQIAELLPPILELCRRSAATGADGR